MKRSKQLGLPASAICQQLALLRAPPLSLIFSRQGLRDLGYVEGSNISIEYRSLDGSLERLHTVLAELVQSKVDVLYVASLTGIRAAKQATKTIPIVMMTTADPVAAGLIDSLARPGGNITGLTLLTRELTGKQLELLKEVAPAATRAGFLLDADSKPAAARFKEYESAAQTLGDDASVSSRTKAKLRF